MFSEQAGTPAGDAQAAQDDANEAASEAVEEVQDQAEQAAEEIAETVLEAQEVVEEEVEQAAEVIAASTGFDEEAIKSIVRAELDARMPSPEAANVQPVVTETVTEVRAEEVVDDAPVEADTTPVPEFWFTRPLRGRNR